MLLVIYSPTFQSLCCSLDSYYKQTKNYPFQILQNTELHVKLIPRELCVTNLFNLLVTCNKTILPLQNIIFAVILCTKLLIFFHNVYMSVKLLLWYFYCTRTGLELTPGLCLKQNINTAVSIPPYYRLRKYLICGILQQWQPVTWIRIILFVCLHCRFHFILLLLFLFFFLLLLIIIICALDFITACWFLSDLRYVAKQPL